MTAAVIGDKQALCREQSGELYAAIKWQFGQSPLLDASQTRLEGNLMCMGNSLRPPSQRGKGTAVPKRIECCLAEVLDTPVEVLGFELASERGCQEGRVYGVEL